MVTVEYIGPDWLFINAGNSLCIVVDGRLVELSCTSPSRQVLAGDVVAERAFYPITAEVLRQIADGKIVKVRIVGNTFEDCTLTEENMNRIREFVARHVF